MWSPELISFLASDEGKRLFEAAISLPGDELSRITHLRKTYPNDQVAAAIELLDLRARARTKFSRADEMFFTREGLEQSSSEAVARWRAARFPQGTRILDLCCGIGGDAIALAGRGNVYAFDLQPVTAACAAANLAVSGLAAEVVCADVTKLRLKADAAFFDPSRRRSGRRVKSAKDYSPPLDFVHEIRRHISNAAVKVSPAIDDKTLAALGGRVEFVSDRGECKEAVVWFGDMGPSADRSASIVGAGACLAARHSVSPSESTAPRDWLFEPDPAVIRAHLIPELCEQLGARHMDPMIAYLTAGNSTRTPYGTWYRVLEWFPFSLKRIQERISVVKGQVVAFKKRGVPFEPEDLMRRIKSRGDRPVIVIVTRVKGDIVAMLCDPPLQQ